jgi:hypothetical protein
LVDRLDDVLDEDLLRRVDGLSNIQLGKLDEFYSSSFLKPRAANIIRQNPDGSFIARTTHPNAAKVVEVDYDKNGFPNFNRHSPGRDYHIQRRSTDNYDQDFSNATVNLRERFPNNVLPIPNSTAVLIKVGNTWEKYTWHHHQDGRTLIPVLSDVHNYTAHTGGQSIITKGLVDLFDAP